MRNTKQVKYLHSLFHLSVVLCLVSIRKWPLLPVKSEQLLSGVLSGCMPSLLSLLDLNRKVFRPTDL
ncbi:hypothetical protein CDAR_64251 [Caerostris darwini]|uniref:Uncharacterized protein n=1 Tax=Caerostris darwini TaxID=1538125 RepID=A0AAV4QJ39_9ARAC|nr:hypothetical protein CDAR_64251 [Caerostris darwini]